MLTRLFVFCVFVHQEDFARVIHRTYGKCGGLVLLAMQLLGGDGDEVGDQLTKNMQDRSSRLRAITQAAGFEPSEFSSANKEDDAENDPRIRAEVRDQITEGCIISEMAASLVLFAIVAAEELFASTGFGGENAINVSDSDR